VGVDFSGTSDAALQWVRELEAFGPCEITAAHLNWPPEDQKRLGVSSRCVMGDNEPLVQEVLERDLRAKVAGALGHHRAEICVRASWGCVDAHLVELAANSGADLIVAGSHQWHGLNRLRRRSISRNILHHAPMSVACVPAPVHTGTAAPHIARHERVLVAAAFDEHGAMAIPHAYATVEAGGVVRLLHVLEPLPLSKLLSSPEARTDHHQQEERTARAAAQLRAMIPPEAEKLGITSEVEVVESSEAARAICQAAARFGADLLCIGAHSHLGLMAKVMGPVALGTLKHSECPVLIVWPPRE
jgi:nucleotide-binding universal stress UspA family protein